MNTNNPKSVSVIVPVYNAEKNLNRCLGSIVKQDLTGLEVILVDDGSTDNSGEICDYYQNHYENVTVIHKTNGGVAKARNDGIELANGDYIIFSDSDDEVPQGAYKRMYEEAQKTDADLIIGDVYQVLGDYKKYCHFYDQDFFSSDEKFINELIKADFYRNYCPCPYRGKVAFGYGGPWNKLVRRSLITQNAIRFNTNVRGIFDDIIYTAYVLNCAQSVSYISVPVYSYYIYEESVTHGYNENILAINEAIFGAWEEFLEKSGKKQLLLPAFYANVLRRFSESIERFFYYKISVLGEKKALNSLALLMQQTPYNDVVRYAEFDVLSAYHKALFLAIRIKSARLAYAIYIMRVVMKKVLKK